MTDQTRRANAVLGATDDGRLRIHCPACEWDATYPCLDLLTVADVVRDHCDTHVTAAVSGPTPEAKQVRDGEAAALDDVCRFADAWRDGDATDRRQITYRALDRDHKGVTLTERQLRAVLDERERLVARIAELEAHPWIEVVWLTADGEGNFGVWNDPDRARRQIASDRAAETPGTYEWVNDADRTRELLLRDDEPTGLALWMALVADAAELDQRNTADDSNGGAE